MAMHSIFSKIPRRAALLLAASVWCACASSRPPPTETPAAATSAAASSPAPAPHLRPAAPPAPAASSVKAVAEVTVAAVGDVIMHGAVKDAAADHRKPDNDDGFGWLWAPVADLLGSADVAFANLETPIAPASGQGSRSFVFNAPPAMVRALGRAGIRLVSVANNHMFDQGRAGFEETLQQLEAARMPYVGAGETGREAGPRLVQANGLRIAFLAYSRFFNQSGNECPSAQALRGRRCVRASLLDPDRAVSDVQAAAREADAVVVSLHWGDEYQAQPREADVALARRLVDAGALIVLGHHPHVLQPVELLPAADGRTALVAYSLGNFVSNQSRHYVHGVSPSKVAATRDGILLRATIVRRDYGHGLSRVELGRVAWWPLWTENDTAEAARGRRRPAIQVVSLDRALAEVRAEVAALPEPLSAADRTRYIGLRQREELYLARRAAIAATVGEDLQAEAPTVPAPASAASHGP